MRKKRAARSPAPVIVRNRKTVGGARQDDMKALTAKP